MHHAGKMIRPKRKRNLVDRFVARSIKGDDVNDSLFSEFCETAHSLYRKDLLAHYGCVNAVEFSEDGTLIVSGSDDRRVLLWSNSEALCGDEKSTPLAMEAEHGSNVFCIAVSTDNQRIFSGGNDFQTIIHDTKTAKPVDYFLHEKPVYGISLQTSSPSIFATACDDGKLRIFDMRASSTTAETIIASKRSPFHSLMFHPLEGRIVASASIKDGPELWDLRNPLTQVNSPVLIIRLFKVTQPFENKNRCLHRFPNEKGAMSVRFDYTGNRLLCLQRREPPKIFHLYHDGNIQLNAEGYNNACTMKSCCFAGDRDQFAVSGSDDHKIYVWKVPKSIADDEQAIIPDSHLLLAGHRSVVNHVRYNSVSCCLASCGVEKMIKIWSPVAFPKSTGGLDKASADELKPRKRLTRLSRECNMIIAPSANLRSTDEDKKMLAFFDLLVERSSWFSSGEEESASDLDTEEERLLADEYDVSSSSSVVSFDVDDSFEIDSVSTPSSSSSSSLSSSSSSSTSSEEEPVPGPSGLNKFADSTKLELPSEFHTSRQQVRLRFRGRPISTTSDDDDTSHNTQQSTSNQNRVAFRSFSGPRRKQFRRRTTSSTSSSS